MAAVRTFRGTSEVGGSGQTKLVFFFDEAHLLFDEPLKRLVD